MLNLYDDWGNLSDFRQDYDGVVTNSSPNDLDVHYTYTKVDTTSPTAGTRRSGIRRSTSELYYGKGVSGSGTQKYVVTPTFTNSDSGSTLYDDDIGRVTYVERTYSGSTVTLADYRYGGVGTVVDTYLSESGIEERKAWPGSDWDLGFDRFNRPSRSYIYKNGAGTYADLRVSHDDNGNTTAVENAWVTPWSSTFESDGLNRLKGLKFGVMTTGAISTVVQQEDWQTTGMSPALKLDQVGNWVDYKRVRESVTQDEFAGNTYSNINQYTKLDKVAGGAADILPSTDVKGLPTKDDTTGGSTKGYQYVFDAWDRLTTVKNTSANVVEEFRYNGLGHRIGWHYDTDKDLDVDGSDAWTYFQYNERWQQVALWTAGDTDPTEVFIYDSAGMDGYGGSSYIDDVLIRERDTNANGVLDERNNYLHNWRHDVIAILNNDGQVRERIAYDAYGRPHAFSPGDIKTGGGADRPDGTLNSSDTWTTGSVVWNKDLGNSANLPIPDGVVDSHDSTVLANLIAATYSAGYGILSDSKVGNRRGFAGYEFDPILEGAAAADNKPIYHVRHRVLASDTGKWFQKDPLGYHDSMDLYEYCKSDPIDCLGPTNCNMSNSSASVGLPQANDHIDVQRFATLIGPTQACIPSDCFSVLKVTTDDSNRREAGATNPTFDLWPDCTDEDRWGAPIPAKPNFIIPSPRVMYQRWRESRRLLAIDDAEWDNNTIEVYDQCKFSGRGCKCKNIIPYETIAVDIPIALADGLRVGNCTVRLLFRRAWTLRIYVTIGKGACG